MNKSLRTSVSVLSLVALAACSNKSPSQQSQLSEKININGIVTNKALSKEAKSEELAKAAEQLAQTSSFVYADPILDMAIQQDPSNKRAQFYKSVLAQKMVLRGVVVRIKPLVRKTPKAVADYNKMVAEIPNGALRTFLLDGQEDIKNEKDIQALMDDMYEGREQLRKFLKENKDLSITLNFADLISAEASRKECSYSQVAPGVFEMSASCKTLVVTEVNLNRADIESIQQMVAGAQIYSALLSAYDATGSIDTAKKFENQNNVSNEVVAQELSKYSDFSKLRNKASLTNIVEMGMDAVAGVRWAAEMQKQLCPNGEGAKNQREGMLFKDGICIREQNGKTSLEEVLQQVELSLSGQTIQVGNDNSAKKLNVNLAAPLMNPIQDLKALQPTFDKCGRINSTNDATLGGVFPNGDANEILKTSDSCK